MGIGQWLPWGKRDNSDNKDVRIALFDKTFEDEIKTSVAKVEKAFKQAFATEERDDKCLKSLEEAACLDVPRMSGFNLNCITVTDILESKKIQRKDNGPLNISDVALVFGELGLSAELQSLLPYFLNQQVLLRPGEKILKDRLCEKEYGKEKESKDIFNYCLKKYGMPNFVSNLALNRKEDGSLSIVERVDFCCSPQGKGELEEKGKILSTCFEYSIACTPVSQKKNSNPGLTGDGSASASQPGSRVKVSFNLESVTLTRYDKEKSKEFIPVQREETFFGFLYTKLKEKIEKITKKIKGLSGIKKPTNIKESTSITISQGLLKSLSERQGVKEQKETTSTGTIIAGLSTAATITNGSTVTPLSEGLQPETGCPRNSEEWVDSRSCSGDSNASGLGDSVSSDKGGFPTKGKQSKSSSSKKEDDFKEWITTAGYHFGLRT